MKKLILKGELTRVKSYVEKYILENEYEDYQIRYFHETVKIEDARGIIKELSYVVKDKLLLIFFGNLTLECQNAMLKCIEESQENVGFIFYQEKYDTILPTIISRCHVLDLGQEDTQDELLTQLISEYFDNSSSQWVFIEEMIEYFDKNGMHSLSPTLRSVMLGKIDDYDLTKKTYNSLKSYFKFARLHETNNVSLSTVVERIFSPI